MIRIKICGITSVKDAQTAVAAGADAIGLVFCESPRRIDVAAAQKIRGSLPPFVAAVGLFVNSPIEQIVQVVREVGLSVAQLHGDESPQDVAQLAKILPVIKAFRIRGPEEIDKVTRYADAAGYLFDAYVAGSRGGTGHRFNWTYLSRERAEKIGRPWILAGGLTPDNVEEALTLCRPYALDVSSGVERRPGVKDPQKVEEFIARARGFIHEPSRSFR